MIEYLLNMYKDLGLIPKNQTDIHTHTHTSDTHIIINCLGMKLKTYNGMKLANGLAVVVVEDIVFLSPLPTLTMDWIKEIFRYKNEK